MKDSVASVLEAGVAECPDGAFGAELVAARDQPQRDDAVRGCRELVVRDGGASTERFGRASFRASAQARRRFRLGPFAARDLRKQTAAEHALAPEIDPD